MNTLPSFLSWEKKTAALWSRLVPLAPACAFLLSGCAGGGRALYDAGAGAAGGVIAHQLSDGDPLLTAAGAAGGVLVSEGVQAMAANSREGAYNSGYDRGRSDAAKQQYWILQHAQRQAAATKGQPRVKHYPVPAPVTHPNIKEVPHDVLIRVAE
jgi:hypothetical protein